MHVAGGLSLQQTVARAAELDLAHVSSVALFKRLRCAESWLRSLTGHLLQEQRTMLGPWAVRWPEGVRVIDATEVVEPGVKGGRWRIHYTLRLPEVACDHYALTDSGGGEKLGRFAFKPEGVGLGKDKASDGVMDPVGPRRLGEGWALGLDERPMGLPGRALLDPTLQGVAPVWLQLLVGGGRRHDVVGVLGGDASPHGGWVGLARGDDAPLVLGGSWRPSLVSRRRPALRALSSGLWQEGGCPSGWTECRGCMGGKARWKRLRLRRWRPS